MAGGGLFRRAKNVIFKGGSSKEVSSRELDRRFTPVHADSQEQEHNIIQQPPQQLVHSQGLLQINDGIWLIDEEGAPVRRRGRTTCVDLQNMPLGTRVYIEINENGIPCNIPESILLGSYMGVVARDPMLAPISFSDWHNEGMKPFKKKMLREIESKFEFPKHIHHWILQSLGVKWHDHKASLKLKHWDRRPDEKIIEAVPKGVDPVQWCQLVTQWTQSEDRAIYDRLQSWKICQTYKDESWSSEDAKQKWVHACEFLAEERLTPEDKTTEANERETIMGPEYPVRVRTQGFEVTPTRYFPQSTTSLGERSSGISFTRFAKIEGDMQSLCSEMREFMQRMETHFPLPESSQMGGNDRSSDGS